jgi:hypothetical protein
MKKILFILPALIFILGSCNEFDKLTQFNMEFDQTITIPAVADLSLPLDTQIPDIESNSESKMSVNNSKKDLAEEVLLKEFKLAVNTPADGNFSFLKSIAVYLSADSLEEVKVAWLDSIPDNCGDSLILTTTTADLKDYILKDSFNFRVNTVIDKVITSEYKIDMHSVFYVDTKILGQ